MSQQPDLDPSREFFVTAVDPDSLKTWILLGPFLSHLKALSRVEEVSRYVRDLDNKGLIKDGFIIPWLGWGTCSMPKGSGKVGRLNGPLGFSPES